jgi:hypothetical protein
MRHAPLWFALIACGHSKPDDCPAVCDPADSDCTSFPYEQLPQRCFGICSDGECCRFENGAWTRVIFDCARAVDAGIDGAADA